MQTYISVNRIDSVTATSPVIAMADFMDREADVGSSDEDSVVGGGSGSGSSGDERGSERNRPPSSASNRQRTPTKKKAKTVISSDEDEEDEEEDEEKAKEEMKGFIAVRIHAVWFISNTFISNIVRFWEKLRHID